MKRLLYALALTSLATLSLSAQNYDDRRRITVTGESLVSVAPDRIIVTFGVDTRDVTLLPAKQQNDVIVKRALAAIKGMGISDKNLQTDQVSIEQRFEMRGSQQVLAGYTVRNMFAVTLNDPLRVDALISTALDAGVNYLLNVDFQTTELKKYREQAREVAVKAAREKAEKLASPVGEKVGRAIQINEDSRYAGVSYFSSWSSSNWGSRNTGAGLSQNATVVSGGDAVETIALGKVGIRASVSVMFELVP